MADAGLAGVRHGAAERLEVHRLAGGRLDHLGAGHEHVAHALDHEDEVGQRGRIHRAAGAGADDDGDLGHYARVLGVAVEDLAVAVEGVDALLYAGAARVQDADHRHPRVGGHVHQAGDLVGVRAAERAAQLREVLGEDGGQAPVDRAEAGDHAVALYVLVLDAEIGAAGLHQQAELLEGALVHEVGYPLAGGQLALGLLGRYLFRGAAGLGRGVYLAEFLEGFGYLPYLLGVGFFAGLLRGVGACYRVFH